MPVTKDVDGAAPRHAITLWLNLRPAEYATYREIGGADGGDFETMTAVRVLFGEDVVDAMRDRVTAFGRRHDHPDETIPCEAIPRFSTMVQQCSCSRCASRARASAKL